MAKEKEFLSSLHTFSYGSSPPKRLTRRSEGVKSFPQYNLENNDIFYVKKGEILETPLRDTNILFCGLKFLPTITAMYRMLSAPLAGKGSQPPCHWYV